MWLHVHVCDCFQTKESTDDHIFLPIYVCHSSQVASSIYCYERFDSAQPFLWLVEFPGPCVNNKSTVYSSSGVFENFLGRWWTWMNSSYTWYWLFGEFQIWLNIARAYYACLLFLHPCSLRLWWIWQWCHLTHLTLVWGQRKSSTSFWSSWVLSRPKLIPLVLAIPSLSPSPPKNNRATVDPNHINFLQCIYITLPRTVELSTVHSLWNVSVCNSILAFSFFMSFYSSCLLCILCRWYFCISVCYQPHCLWHTCQSS